MGTSTRRSNNTDCATSILPKRYVLSLICGECVSDLSSYNLICLETVSRMGGYIDVVSFFCKFCVVLDGAASVLNSASIRCRPVDRPPRPFLPILATQSTQRVVDWFMQMTAALKHLHDQKILHRDLKSQNIFLACNDSVIKMGDFGISRLLASSRVSVSGPCIFVCVLCMFSVFASLPSAPSQHRP